MGSMGSKLTARPAPMEMTIVSEAGVAIPPTGIENDASVAETEMSPGIENRANEMLERGQLLDGVLMDTAAWAAVESLLRSVRRDLATAESDHGCRLGARFAPGHRDWAVAEQAELLRLFGQTPLPVTLNEAACMWPRKSITAVFGVMPADQR